MKRRFAVALAFLAGLQACAVTNSLPPPAVTAKDTANDRVLITLDSQTTTGIAAVGTSGRLSYSPVARRERAAQLRIAEEIAARHDMSVEEEWPIPAIEVHCFVLRARDGRIGEQQLAGIAADSRVESVQRMQFFTSKSDSGNADPLASWNRSLDDLLERVHDNVTGRQVRIAVIDAGADLAHEDLDGASISGIDFVDGRQDVPAENHGTAVAGLLGARAANGIGIRGLAPDAQILVLRACWEAQAGVDHATCNSFTLAKALSLALEQDIDVVNLSISGPRDSLLERIAAKLVHNGQLVVAAGNDRKTFPGSIADSVLAANFASSGDAMLTLLPQDRYGMRRGTSILAARVSGVAALVRELHPGVTANSFHSLLKDGIENESSLQEIVRLLDVPAALPTTSAPAQ